ncbi:MAG: WbuC family cupin fold metalloprotein [Agarilytica sp.]
MKTLGLQDFENLYHRARESSRKGAHLLLHDDLNQKLQRLFIGMVKGSFVEPHFHSLPNQWEMFHVIKGKIEVKLYDENGRVTNQFLAGCVGQ